MPNQGRSFLDRKGITLIAAIILIVFASIAILGIVTFIIQRLSQEQTQQIRTKCIYLAQAGIHQAIYFFRFHRLTGAGYFSLGQTEIDSNNFFVLDGRPIDLLMVNTSVSILAPIDFIYWQLSGLEMQNATNSKTITIDRMIVTWDNGQRLTQILIKDSETVWTVWTGSEGPPANCDINDFSLDQIPRIYDIFLNFAGDMSRVTSISIQFFMTDGSSTSEPLIVFPASQNYSFTVKSTGQTTNSDIYRTIEADYNVLAGKIIRRYHEIDTQSAAD